MLLTKNGPRDMVNVSNSRECITMKYESMQQALEALKKLEQTPCVSLLPVYMWDFYAPMHPGLTARPISPSLTCDIILTVASFSECSVPARAFIECTKEFIKDSLT